MPTNAEIHDAIDLLIRQPQSHILTNDIADMLDDMVDNLQSGPPGGLFLELSATFAAIAGGPVQRLVVVAVDETNNSDKSLYLHDGTTLLFLQTIA